jgi:AbrB family looped-hinge helix DNA binding protein
MPSSSLTSKGQVTVPKAIREFLNVTEGDRLDFVVQDGLVVVRPGVRDLRALKGVLRRPGQKPASVEDMQVAIEAGRARRR